MKIGHKEFKYKKDAIAYYRAILNSYEFGQSLNDSHFSDILDLIDFDYFNYLADNEPSRFDCNDEIENVRPTCMHNSRESLSENTFDDKIENIDSEELEELLISDIKVSKVQFNTKCFEVFYNNNTSQYISYLMMINNKKFNPESLFYIACRNSIHCDIHSVKQEYFNNNSEKGRVKCQETGILSKWEELVVDHRQPNTFSIIVDRFKELNNIDLGKIEYASNDQNLIIFKDDKLNQEFRRYHKEKASLRIVRKECNSSRTGLARIRRTAKDLTVK